MSSSSDDGFKVKFQAALVHKKSRGVRTNNPMSIARNARSHSGHKQPKLFRRKSGGA